MSIIDKPIVKTLMLKGEKGDPGDLDSTAIVDNLTTNRADKVLSAKQGKVLKDLVDANKIVSDHGIFNLNSALDLKANTADVASEYATKESVNDNISSLDAKVNSLASGSPLVASSISGMTDTTKVYVNTTDGKWYYYDGNSWEIGGTYQSTEIADNSIGYNKLSRDLIDFNNSNINNKIVGHCDAFLDKNLTYNFTWQKANQRMEGDVLKVGYSIDVDDKICNSGTRLWENVIIKPKTGYLLQIIETDIQANNNTQLTNYFVREYSEEPYYVESAYVGISVKSSDGSTLDATTPTQYVTIEYVENIKDYINNSISYNNTLSEKNTYFERDEIVNYNQNFSCVINKREGTSQNPVLTENFISDILVEQRTPVIIKANAIPTFNPGIYNTIKIRVREKDENGTTLKFTDINVGDSKSLILLTNTTNLNACVVVTKNSSTNNYNEVFKINLLIYVDNVKLNPKIIVPNFYPIDVLFSPKMQFGAHRGARLEAPENSIPAYRIAGQEGWDWAWIAAVRQSADGTWYVMHDATVDRTTDGTGEIANLTDAQISNIHIDVGPNIEQYSQSELVIPTLETVLQICRRYGMRVCIRLGSLPVKYETEDEKQAWDSLLELVNKYMLGNSIFSGRYKQVKVLKSLSNNYHGQVLTDESVETYQTTRDVIDSFIDSNFTNCSVLAKYEATNPGLVQYAHLNGYRYVCYSEETPTVEMLENASNWGVDIYQNAYYNSIPD